MELEGTLSAEGPCDWPVQRSVDNFVSHHFVFRRRHYKLLVPSTWCLFRGKSTIPHREMENNMLQNHLIRHES